LLEFRGRRGRVGGKAEIGKAESLNRKAEGAVVSGSFLPPHLPVPRAMISHFSFPDFSFQVRGSRKSGSICHGTAVTFASCE
jgi:hypothetical protein